MDKLCRRSFGKSLDGSQVFIREQALVSCHKVNRSEIAGEGRGMIEQTILAVFCLAGVGFMLYVLFSLQREIRRENRERLGATVRINLQQDKLSLSTLVDGTEKEMNVFDKRKTHAIGPIDCERPEIGFDLQPIRKRASGGSR
jgi:hypothetical protein